MGCVNAITINLTVNASPNVIATAQNSTICEGDTTQINGSGADTYHWNYGIGSGPTKYVSPVANMTYVVTGTDSSTGCTDTSSITIIVNSLPAPVINQNGNNLTVTSSYISYQWYFNGSPLVGDTNQTITSTQNGNYMVEVTNSNNCSGTASFNFTTVGIRESFNEYVYTFPNPVHNKLTIYNTEYKSVTIINGLGEIVKTSLLFKGNNELSLEELPQGYYILQFVNGKTVVHNQALIKN